MQKFKKIIAGAVLTIMMFSITLSAIAENNIKVMLDDVTLSFDVQPQIINDRTMVPLRAIFEALGANVDWNSQTRTVTSSKGSTTIELTIDSSKMYVNDKKVSLDSPACIVNDRTLVPLRAISEAFNCKVDWDGQTRTVFISTPKDTTDYKTITTISEPVATPKVTPKATTIPTTTPKSTDVPNTTPKVTEKPQKTEKPIVTERPVENNKTALTYEEAVKYLDKYLKKNTDSATYKDIVYKSSAKTPQPMDGYGELVYEFLLKSKSDGEIIDALYVHENGQVTTYTH